MPIKNILVVDDSPTDRQHLTDILAKGGYNVSTAASAEEGIAKAKRAGVHFGRTKALTPEQAEELRALRAEGVTLAALMRHYGLGKTAVYRYLACAADPQHIPTTFEQCT